MSKHPPDPRWQSASRVIRCAAKINGWRVTYYGGGGSKQRDWIMLEPPPAVRSRALGGLTMAYRRGDDFMRRGPYYSLLARYDQQERMPLP